MRTNILYILSCCLFALFTATGAAAQEIPQKEGIRIPAEREPVEPILDSIRIEAPIPELTPGVPQDTVPTGPQYVTGQVVYSADSYMRLSPRENRLYLYDNAVVTYGDIKITAGKIVLDNETNEVYAYGIVDSSGAYTQKPVFTQADNVVKPDSIRFNFDTEKALVLCWISGNNLKNFLG